MARILVTGIGGNVAQGVLGTLSAKYKEIYIVGTNTKLVSAGNHLCDEIHEVPLAYDENYPLKVKEITSLSKIDLIIPTTDYEAYFLKKYEKEFSLPLVIAPSEKTAEIFLDKYLTSRSFFAKGIPFAETFLPSEYPKIFSDVIVKPRMGRGSREVYYNPKLVSDFDDTFVVQKLQQGIEITTGFYVTMENLIHGHITMKRELSYGTTIACSVTKDYDEKIFLILQKMVKAFEIRGPCNIQSIVTPENEIIPFEVNGRISGTNSIRNQFGFHDVEYLLNEYLFHTPLQPSKIKMGSALRVFRDIIYPDIDLEAIKNSKDRFYVT